MIYRLMEVSNLYGECAKKIDFNNLSYAEALKKVNEGFYFESDFIHKYFREELGLESTLVYYGCIKLQEKWDENKDKEPFSILLRQIQSFQPDVLYVSDISNLSRQQLKKIREVLNEKVLLSCYTFSIINEQAKKVLPEYDLVFTGSDYQAEKLRDYSEDVFVVRHAFEPSILNRISEIDVSKKVGFIGSIMIGRSIHTNRIDMLSELAKREIPFDFYGKVYGSFLNTRSFVDHILHEPLKMKDRINMEKHLQQNSKPSQFGIDYYKTMIQYAVNLNIHAKIAGTGAGNMRMFEATGVGSCLVTDKREENKLLFDEDREIVVYRTPEEMAEKVKYLFDHPSEMKKIAENGQKRTLQDHNYRNKALTIDSIIQKRMRKT